MDGATRLSKKRKLSPDTYKSTDVVVEDADAFTAQFSRNAVSWNLEESYEKRSKARKKDEKKQRLPLKTAKGVIEQYEDHTPSKDSNSARAVTETPSPTPPPSPPIIQTKSLPRASEREQILNAKESLAHHATLLNESPEENVGSLKTLAQLTASPLPAIVRLGLATQLAVYTDLIPGYRIRPLSEQEAAVKVSKEVKKQRTFEQAILRGYQNYIRELKRLASFKSKSPTEAEKHLVDLATGCACNLVNAVSHFNFRGELLSILVDKVGSRSLGANFTKCATTLGDLFANDDEGAASLETVKMLAKIIKAREYRVHETVLNLFLRLRLLSEFSKTASDTKVSESENVSSNTKAKKKHWEHRSKKERKALKERKEIEKEMQQADAIVSHEEKDKNQAETLKIVFGIYFRILKARVPGLMGAVLEGLVRYAHLVNQDFFGDLLEALRELVLEQTATQRHEEYMENNQLEEPLYDRNPQNEAREVLLCIITAFGLLQGQDVAKSASSLGLDLGFFVTHLYGTLHALSVIPDIETSSRKLKARDPDADTSAEVQILKINVSTTIVLLLRSLRATLLPANVRTVSPIRLAAFSKQLMTCSLQTPERSSTAILGLISETLKTHRGKINDLWNTEERKGNGVFDPHYENLEGSNPFASTVWEGELLQLHYSEQVREGTKNLYLRLQD